MTQAVRVGSLFAGYGGLDLAVKEVFGGALAWYSEIDKGPLKILAHRFPTVPNIGDATAVDWSQVEPVEILTGGSPCQDLSHAGRRAGMAEGTRSNLWVAMREAIAQLRPKMVIWENVRGAYSATAVSAVEPCPGCMGDRAGVFLRALGRVLGDLSDLGYDAQWHGLRAADIGAAHRRFRVFIVAADTRSETRVEWSGLRADESTRGGRRQSARDGRSALYPTPTGRDHKGHNQRRDTTTLTGALLPTPNGFHMKNTESPAEWLQRRAEVELRTGTRHGPALPVIAASVAEGMPLVQDGQGPRLADPGADRWGPYAAAVHHWEEVLGRPAPEPTEPSPKTGNPRLAPAFPEWLMGLPDGWVTEVPGITRSESLKALGNGVVPQQASEAIRIMLARMERVT